MALFSSNMTGAKLVALASFIFTSATIPAQAQSSADDPYNYLVQTLAGDEMARRSFESEMEHAFVAVLRADAEFMELDAECPGALQGLVDVNRPIMWESHLDDFDWYRAELDRAFRNELSPEHAEGMANFFASELGQRFFDTIFQEQRFDRTIAKVMEDDGDKIDAETLLKDKTDTATRSLMALEPVDRQELTHIFATEEWAMSLIAIQPRLREIQLQLANREFTPDQDAQMDQRTEEFVTRHFDACYAGE